MRIIFSPAKQMRDMSMLPYAQLPAMLERSALLLDTMREMSPLDLQQLWGCSDKLVKENLARLEGMKLRENLSPSLFAYEGIAYKYLSPETLSDKALSYLNRNLRILSGFYGILRPDDGVCAYRLEMQARLKTENAKDLYSFWGESLCNELRDGSGVVINLASKEYSVCIERHLKKNESFINCVFAELSGTKLVQKGVYAKMARGEMLRFLAENTVESPSEMREFNSLGFGFDASRSDDKNYVFTAVNPG